MKRANLFFFSYSADTFSSSPQEAPRAARWRRALSWRQKGTLITARRRRGARRSAHLSLSIAPHPFPHAHIAPHWGSYSNRGTARITRTSVRKIHIRGGFISTALQVMPVFINLSPDMYFQLFESHVGSVMYWNVIFVEILLRQRMAWRAFQNGICNLLPVVCVRNDHQCVFYLRLYIDVFLSFWKVDKSCPVISMHIHHHLLIFSKTCWYRQKKTEYRSDEFGLGCWVIKCLSDKDTYLHLQNTQ